MDQQQTPSVNIREACEYDIPGIRDLFAKAYGANYAFPEFFDVDYLKRLIHNNDCMMLVAENIETRCLLGTGSVVYDVGALTDLVGEFGRLVVDPDARGLRIASRLMEERLARVSDYLHVGLADNRVAHPYSQRISQRHGFVPVGLLPIHNGEPVALFARYFNDSLSLRRNHPRVAPELYWIAEAALTQVGIKCGAIVDEAATTYPNHCDFQLEPMSAHSYAALLAFERGRLRNRDIFGPVKLHFGVRALERHNTNYLLARRNGQLVGAIGYSHDANIDNAVRIFELIYIDDKPIRFLLVELERYCREEWKVDYIETDVSSDSPRMQKTLLELGFLPTAYIPSAVFHYTERLDTIRMAKYFIPIDCGDMVLTDEARPIAEGVVARFSQRWIDPVVSKSLLETGVFSDLNEEQASRLANLFDAVRFKAGDWIVRENDADGCAYVLFSGAAEVVAEGGAAIGKVSAGEFVGELALLNDAPHSASVRALEDVEGAVIRQEELLALLKIRGDIGFAVYRNVAAGLADKLKRACSPTS